MEYHVSLKRARAKKLHSDPECITLIRKGDSRTRLAKDREVELLGECMQCCSEIDPAAGMPRKRLDAKLSAMSEDEVEQAFADARGD